MTQCGKIIDEAIVQTMESKVMHCGHMADKSDIKKTEAMKIEKLTLVFFYATWCGHSQRALPEFEKLMKKEKELSIKIIMLEVSEHKETFEFYKITGYPTMKFFDQEGKAHNFEPKTRTYDDMMHRLKELGIQEESIHAKRCGS